MKPTALCVLSILALGLFTHAGETAPANMQEHAKWARAPKEPAERIERLEKFMDAYLPAEEGGKHPAMRGYGDGSHVLAVAGCGWDLARAYVEAGKKEEALKMIDWLQRHDSKSMLAPVASAKPDPK